MAGGPMAGGTRRTRAATGPKPLADTSMQSGPPTLGIRLRALRTGKGLTLSLLSGASGLSVSYLNDIEHDRTLPRMAALHNIAKALDTNVRDLLDGVDPFGL